MIKIIASTHFVNVYLRTKMLPNTLQLYDTGFEISFFWEARGDKFFFWWPHPIEGRDIRLPYFFFSKQPKIA